mmetsp:Transcript_9242/g.16137  ORF Transcript_9242/g.16137 Transcript_9242/m.16137 type:complete len:613 (+) Transcript_9242:68-1906(+)
MDDPACFVMCSNAFTLSQSRTSSFHGLPRFPTQTLKTPNVLKSRRIRSTLSTTTTTTTTTMSSDNNIVTVLDYGAGNVRSLENALIKLGMKVQWVKKPQDILNAQRLVFPGVGSFGAAMYSLKEHDYINVLREYITQSKRPFFGICLGLQTLFDASEESPGVKGLEIFPGTIRRFDDENGAVGVPHIGWNSMELRQDHANDASKLLFDNDHRYYFVHSYRLEKSDDKAGVLYTSTTHGHQAFASSIQSGNVFATQCHPEKSGEAGLQLLNYFIRGIEPTLTVKPQAHQSISTGRGLSKRVIACLDVRENDQGDLVVTKGDQYDVREKDGDRNVRNLGKPVSLAKRYYDEGADEITFLNITSFRGEPLSDAPMLEVLERTSENVFVPLCIGGGIRDYVDQSGKSYSALDVASRYFRAGADKISLGSDAVYAAEKYYKEGKEKSGTSSIEQISYVYGAQAVVISVDPKKVYVADPSQTKHVCAKADHEKEFGPNGEQYWWYQCTVKGGREGRDLDIVQLIQACEALGAGEILLNSMDADGSNAGYDLKLVKMAMDAVSIPVIASSGAGKPKHFVDVFEKTNVQAALAAGIFHRKEVSIDEVKQYMKDHGIRTRM